VHAETVVSNLPMFIVALAILTDVTPDKINYKSNNILNSVLGIFRKRDEQN